MSRPAFELAGIFREYGASYRAEHRLPREHLRVMRAIAVCRSATLGGHVERCSQCEHTRIAYNSCRNRHCPKCQGAERQKWLESRGAELLPVEYFHVVFTIPEPLAKIALQNKRAVYGILLATAAETLQSVARDPKHLGAVIGFFGILHTWGQNLLHHPHVHMVVPGGGLAPDHERWIHARRGFFLPVKVLSRLFRRLFLEALEEAFRKDQLQFFGELESLQQQEVFAESLRALRQTEWVVYTKPPFGGAQQALAYLGRYTHRVAIANERIRRVDEGEVSFQWKDYRSKDRHRSRVMKLDVSEFIRRFLLHTLPAGFQRIRHFGFLSNRRRATLVPLCRRLLTEPVTQLLPEREVCRGLARALSEKPPTPCPECGKGIMIRLGFVAGYLWPARPPDTS
jgi:hypothetical protein